MVGFSLGRTRTAGSRTGEYLAELGLDDLESGGAFVARTEVTLAPPKEARNGRRVGEDRTR